MDSLLHIGGTLVTLLFLGAVIYSLTTSYRKRQKKAQQQKDLVSKKHVQVKNLHQYDIAPQNGYCVYPLPQGEQLQRYPQTFTALSLTLANQQPYSICLIGFAEYEKGELKDTHYFYVRPPENKLNLKDHPELTWDILSKADEFGEYWNAGMKEYFTTHTLVAHHASYLLGCVAHALKIYGIDMPPVHFIDTLETAKKLYHFSSNQLAPVCQEMGIELDEKNTLSAAVATGQFLIKAKQEYPMYLPTIQYIHAAPTQDQNLASVIAAVEREECTPEEIFAPNPVNQTLLQTLLDKKYIEPGEKEGTYYATNEGLDFSESVN